MKIIKKEFFYLTTPIFYPNAEPHPGHAYSLIVADIITNYKKSRGYLIYFQTGSDDHGEKIEKKATSLNLSPLELVDKNVLIFKKLWEKLGISDYNFYRTSSAEHIKKTQEKFNQLLKKGNIYLGNYQGKYCISCEDYVTEKKAVEGKYCPAPSCKAILRMISEPAYFFRVSKYHEQLLKYYQENPDFISPNSIKKELLSNFLNEKKLSDLCITRSDIKWGIPVPNEKKMVIYVWFEALLNYINSEAGEKNFSDSKNEIVHLIGKEIVRFHCIYWPAILFALEKRLPNKFLAHGWLVDSQGEKESKSKGNMNNPFELLKKYPADLLRIYFIAKINFLKDGTYSEKALEEFYNSFLVNNLGNLVSRVSKMISLYNKGVVPEFTLNSNQELKKYYEQCEVTVKIFQEKMDNYELTEAFNEVEKFLRLSNKLISDLTPWNIFKEKNMDFLNSLLNYLVNGIKIVAFLLNSIIPETSSRIFNNFNIEKSNLDWNNLLIFSFVNNTKIKNSEEHLFSPFKK